MAKIKHSLIKIFTGSDLSSRKIPVMIAKSNKKGPVVWLTACSHGDEVGGMVVVQEVIKKLEKLLLNGKVYAFPLMNPLGFETTSRDVIIGSEDLNRSFPGDKNGSIAERIAEKIFSTIIKTKPDLVLDLHNDWRNSIPHALIDPEIKNKKIKEKVENLAKMSDLLAIRETKEDLDSEDLDSSLSFTLNSRNIPSLTLELGEAYVVNEKNVEDGIKTVLNILAKFRMVEVSEGDFNYKFPKQFENKLLTYSQQYITSINGVIRFFAEPGSIVKKGQLVARVYDAFGKLQENVTALNDGIVLGYSDYSVAIPGIPVISFGII